MRVSACLVLAAAVSLEGCRSGTSASWTYTDQRAVNLNYVAPTVHPVILRGRNSEFFASMAEFERAVERGLAGLGLSETDLQKIINTLKKEGSPITEAELRKMFGNVFINFS